MTARSVPRERFRRSTIEGRPAPGAGGRVARIRFPIPKTEEGPPRIGGLPPGACCVYM